MGREVEHYPDTAGLQIVGHLSNQVALCRPSRVVLFPGIDGCRAMWIGMIDGEDYVACSSRSNHICEPLYIEALHRLLVRQNRRFLWRGARSPVKHHAIAGFDHPVGRSATVISSFAFCS